MSAIFVFGTLRHLPLLEAVAGARVAAEPASLADHVAVHAVSDGGEEMDFPVLVPRSGARAEGLVLHPDPRARARLDAYERAFLYETAPVQVDTARGPVTAAYYVPRVGVWRGGADWSLADWARLRGALTTEAAAEVMALLADQKDPRATGAGDVFESYPRFGSMRPQLGGFAEQGLYNEAYRQPSP